jgi:hypothetical protein
MSSLLKIETTPVGSLQQREAAIYVGGLEALRELEKHWGLVPWDRKATSKRYRVSAIEEAMKRAERAQERGSAEGGEGNTTTQGGRSPSLP